MRLTFHGPFRQMAASEAAIALELPMSLRALIGLLAERYPGLKPYTAYETDEALGAHVTFLARGGVLGLADMVSDDDRIHMMLPVVGG